MDVRLVIEDLDTDGLGTGHTPAGLEVHVAGALPGEAVRAQVRHKSPHAPRAWAELVSQDAAPSPDRVAPACPGHGRCGGCVLQHLAYPAQLRFKRDRLRRALAAHASGGLHVPDVEPSPRELGYRNKGKYVLWSARPGAPLVYGSYAPGTHRVVDMAGCRVVEEPIDAVAREATTLLAASGLDLYDERTLTGELRYLVVRANHAGAALVVVVTRTDAPRAALAALARTLADRQPAVAGVVHDVNASSGGALLGGGATACLHGRDVLTDRVGTVSLELSAGAFFQVNRLQAARLYDEVVRAAGPLDGVRAADVYCGAGPIALCLAAARARAVAGVETSEAAVADARRSAAAAGLDGRVQFVVADAARGLDEARAALGGLDVVVVNPPRKGLQAAGRDALARAGATRVVYVSCGPESLAADLAALAALGYRAERLRAFDVLPGTPHVETVATLVRAVAT